MAQKWKDASFGDTIHYTRNSGANATYSFVGDEFQIYSQAGPGGGKFDVSVDDEFVATIDTYNPKFVHQQLVFASEMMVPNEHEIKITARSDSNPASRNRFVHIDYIQINETLPNGYVIDANHHDIDYDSEWEFQEHDDAFYNSVYFSNTTDSRARYSFTGSGVTIYTRKGDNHGQCKVTIDGEVVDIVDTYKYCGHL